VRERKTLYDSSGVCEREKERECIYVSVQIYESNLVHFLCRICMFNFRERFCVRESKRQRSTYICMNMYIYKYIYKYVYIYVCVCVYI